MVSAEASPATFPVTAAERTDLKYFQRVPVTIILLRRQQLANNVKGKLSAYSMPGNPYIY